eukprot:SAG11_NODE_440_length_9448_cov_3.356509_8_plen_64_part_00
MLPLVVDTECAAQFVQLAVYLMVDGPLKQRVRPLVVASGFIGSIGGMIQGSFTFFWSVAAFWC